MKAGKFLFAGLLAASFVPAVAMAQDVAPSQAPAPRIERRKRNQQRRIAQGVGNGQLTPRETARLERKEARVNRREARMRASGGKFTPRERRAINRQQNRVSRQIYREKHDAQHQ